MPRPGPAPTELDSEERGKFLGLLRAGFGVQMALADLKVGWRRYARTARADKGFRREVAAALAYRLERLVALRYTAAVEGDARAQEYLIDRDDRASRFARELRQRRAELAARAPQTDPAEGQPPRIILPRTDDRHPPRTG